MSTRVIRSEQAGDATGIARVQELAFPTNAEARLVENLRRAQRLTLSLVAELEGEIVGHVAFSPITIEENVRGWGLAPLAVLPAFQRQGIGAALVRAGIDGCRDAGIGLVVLLGSPAYYGRFGFAPASRWNLRDEYHGGDAFQALELLSGAVPEQGGLVKYSQEFAVFAE